MATVGAPITRSELMEVLQNELRHCATKADLKDLENKLTAELLKNTRWNIGMMFLVGTAAVAILRLT